MLHVFHDICFFTSIMSSLFFAQPLRGCSNMQGWDFSSDRRNSSRFKFWPLYKSIGNNLLFLLLSKSPVSCLNMRTDKQNSSKVCVKNSRINICKILLYHACYSESGFYAEWYIGLFHLKTTYLVALSDWLLDHPWSSHSNHYCSF